MEDGLLKEALNDADNIGQAAVEHAKNMLVEQLTPNVRKMVSDVLGEGAESENLISEAHDSEDDKDSEEKEMNERELKASEDAQLTLEAEEEEDEEKMKESVEITEEEVREALQGAIQDALQEADVSSGFKDEEDPNLNSPGEGMPDRQGKGLMPCDEKEKGWEEKEAPAAEDWTVEAKQEIARLKSENAALKTSVKEYKESCGKLASKLKEVSLFSSKLLYANKLMKEHGVDPKVRKGIIESLDEARSVREAELIHRTLSETLPKITRENVGNKARASRHSGATSTLKEVMNRGEENRDSGDSFSKRMQMVAGLLD